MKLNFFNIKPQLIAIVLIITTISSSYCHRIKEINPIESHISSVNGGEEHDPTIDHDSFLGTEEAKVFDKLSPEESKSRLRRLIEAKVDGDGDGLVSEAELRRWIAHIARLSKERERDDLFPEYATTNETIGAETLLDYETYRTRIYGGVIEEQLDPTSLENLAIMKMQDERKWKLADENGDNKLNRDEFLVFQHPEDYIKMKELVIQETMEVSDKNKDGFLDLTEYINDIWPPGTSSVRPEESVVKQEEETFATYRDKNGDQKLDRDEVGQWLMPEDYDPVEAETRHLLHIADGNEDGQLTMDEIMGSYDTFVGSQLTGYGNYLKHDEL